MPIFSWKDFKPQPIIFFLLLMTAGSILVAINFGPLAVALGWLVLLLAVIILSIEPFTSALLAVGALLASGFVFSLPAALGATILVALALLFAALLLFWRSWRQGRENRQHRRAARNKARRQQQ